ncbi:MAG TPA: LuxR C-terminal-related transcriptional regulator [Solirubrobacteraceae bacterium]|nr:LuxR C-terminal-related transcriptional regulator [Solirubrobacteraceae bacterium]
MGSAVLVLEASPSVDPAARTIERALLELLALERELCELEYVRRADALERAGDAVRVLGEVASSDGILGRAAAELGVRSQFDRVLISEVTGDLLLPLALWTDPGEPDATGALDRLRRAPIRLAYPLREAEVARQRTVETVSVGEGGRRAPRELADALGLRSYVVGPLVAQGETIGLLHADTQLSGRTVDEIDAEVIVKFTQGLSGVLERAVLRHTLELHRGELQSAAQWMSRRLSTLSEAETVRPASEAGRQMVQSLTPRELEVLRLLGRGNTNLEIARALVVREGTVKYHVKNILRKLGATSRADAVSRFVRSSSPEHVR